MGVYYPSARVRFVFRLEEFADTAALDGQLSSTAAGAAPLRDAASPGPNPGNRQQVEEQLEELDALISSLESGEGDYSESIRADLLAESRGTREVLLGDLGLSASGSGAGEPPEVLGAPAPDDRVTSGDIIPISCEIERNAPRQADTATVIVSHRDMPFDPRLLRAVGIEITIGIVPPAAYQAGVRGSRADDGSLESQVQRSTTLAGTDSRLENTTRFVGWVDEANVVFSDKGDEVTFTCRDLSALFFDQPLATGTAVNLQLPIDQGVREFLAGYPALRGFTVVYGRPGQQAGSPPVPASAAPRALQARRGRAVRQQRSGDQRQNVWDHLTDVCVRVGLQPIVYDYQLHIVEPRTFFASRRVRRMVYGRNLKHLEFTRKLSGSKVPTIEVRSYDADLGRTRWARWPSPSGQPGFGVLGQSDPPSRPTRANETTVAGHAPDERIQTITVQGISDGAVLQRVARNTFEQLGRQEIEGNFETDDVRSFDSESEADLLQLDAGDAVELLIAGGPRIPGSQLSASELQALGRRGRADYLRSIGWSDRVAELFAQLQEAAGFQSVFYVRNARLSWSASDGFAFTADFVNFVEVREDAGLQTALGEPSTAVTTDSQDPTARALLEGRTSEDARALETSLSEREQLQELRSQGLITDEQFAERNAALDEQIPNQAAVVRGEG